MVGQDFIIIIKAHCLSQISFKFDRRKKWKWVIEAPCQSFKKEWELNKCQFNDNVWAMTKDQRMTLFWPQTRPKQTFWSLIVNNTNQGQILPPKICPTNCQPIFFITQCYPNNRHPNLWLNNFLPKKKLQPNDNSKIKLQIPNNGDKYWWQLS